MAYLKMYGGRIQIGKTIDIYSAAVDTIYYMKNGVSVTVGTTDATGKLTVNKSALPNGTYTLYSSVAKDPSNLSNAYSKSVTVDNNTEEIYLMPDGAVYWYGRFVYPQETRAIRATDSLNKVAPTQTVNTTSVKYTLMSAPGYVGGTANIATAIDLTNFVNIKTLVKEAKATSDNYRSSVIVGCTSQLVNGHSWGAKENVIVPLENQTDTITNVIKTVDVSSVSGDNYIAYDLTNVANNTSVSLYIEISAIWLE